MATLPPLCEDPKQIQQFLVELKELEKRRRQVMKVQSTLRGQAGSLVFRCLGGYQEPGKDKATKKALSDRAANVVKAINAGDKCLLKPKSKKPTKKTIKNSEQDVSAFDACEGFVLTQYASMMPQNKLRAYVERQSRNIVRSLPIWQHWAKDICGLGELGIAWMLANGGDAWRYPTNGKLNNRFCWGFVTDGNGGFVQQGKPEHGTPEEWIEHGFDKERKGQLKQFVIHLLWKPNRFTDYFQGKKAGMLSKLTAANPSEEEEEHKTEEQIGAEASSYARACTVRNLICHYWRKYRRYMPKLD